VARLSMLNKGIKRCPGRKAEENDVPKRIKTILFTKMRMRRKENVNKT
jgi:hypothetical protein